MADESMREGKSILTYCSLPKLGCSTKLIFPPGFNVAFRYGSNLLKPFMGDMSSIQLELMQLLIGHVPYGVRICRLLRQLCNKYQPDFCSFLEPLSCNINQARPALCEPNF